MSNGWQKDRDSFESAIRALEAEIANIGSHLVLDSSARQAYAKQINIMSMNIK